MAREAHEIPDGTTAINLACAWYTALIDLPVFCFLEPRQDSEGSEHEISQLVPRHRGDVSMFLPCTGQNWRLRLAPSSRNEQIVWNVLAASLVDGDYR